jgi:WD40 repeat protein
MLAAMIVLSVGLAHGQAPGEKTSQRKDIYGDPLPEGALARCGTNRFRFDDWVTQIVFAPNSKTLAALALEKSIVFLTDADTGKVIQRFQGMNSDPLMRVAFSGDGKLLGALSRWNRIYLWDTTTGQLRHVLNDSGPDISCFAFSPDGKSLVTGARTDEESVLQIWDIATETILHSVCSEEQFAAIAYSPDGKLLAAVQNESIGVWDPATGLMTRFIAANISDVVEPVSSFAFSPDSKHLALTCCHSTFTKCHVWEVASGKVTCELDAAAIAISQPFLPDGKSVASVGDGGAIRWWDVTTGKEVRRAGRIQNKGLCLAQSPDGKLLASGGIQGAVLLWDIATGQPAGPHAAHSEPVMSATLSPNGKLLSTLSRDGSIRIWESRTGKQALLIQPDFASSVYATCFTADGKGLILGGEKETLCIWDLEKNRLKHRMQVPDASVMQLVLSPDGNTLAIGTANGAVLLMDLRTGKEMRRFGPEEFGIGALAFSSDGRAILSVSTEWSGVFEKGSAIRAFEVASGKQIYGMNALQQVSHPFGFSADGSRFAARGQNGVCICDLSTGNVLQELTEAGIGSDADCFVSALAFAPDGRTLAVASSEGTITLWELSTGCKRAGLTGHRDVIYGLAWTADSKLLISASADTTALVWDVTGLVGHADRRIDRLSNKELEARWSQLAMGDGATAHRALGALAREPAMVIPFIKSRLSPARDPAAGRLRQLVDDLDNELFPVRSEATQELDKLGTVAETALRDVLDGQSSAEMRRRVEELLARIECKCSGESLRHLRVVELLERIGTREGRELLQQYAKGAPVARLTREAKASLERLEKR